MTADQICLIIDSCAKANVSSIQIGELRLEFGERAPAKPLATPPVATEPTTPTDAAISDKHDKQNQESLEIEEARTKEGRLALMLIENPAEAERLIASGELDEMDEGGDDDDGS